VIDGHLVVGVAEPGFPRARVLALPAPGADAVVLDVEAPDPGTDAGAGEGTGIDGALPRWSVSAAGR
jgi:hypothetical protein